MLEPSRGRLTLYGPAESEKTHIFARFRWIFTQPIPTNDQKKTNQEPRALKPINIAYLKTLTSVFWLLNRVF